MDCRFTIHWISRVSPALAFAGALVLGLSAADAATIRVAQDGSGDYTSLFDAMAAAQDGDTVSVAPGEYTEPQWANPGGLPFEFMGLLYASNVTVIGDDRDTVLIGPALPPPVPRDDGVQGIGAVVGTSEVTYENLTLRNLSQAIVDGDGAPTIRSCRFVGNYAGVTQQGLGRFEVTDCEFVGNLHGIIAFAGFGIRDIFISDCTFTDNFEAIQLQNPTSEISNCLITGGTIGITTTLGGQLLLHDTTIRDTAARGFHAAAGSVVRMYTCFFEGTMEYNLFSTESSIFARDVYFGGGTFATMYIGAPWTIEVFGNHILNAGGLTILAEDSIWEPKTISLGSNWWGTTDLDQIEEWIEHAPDDPTNNGLTIDFLPFYGGPVPTEESSIGQLKGKFSGQ